MPDASNREIYISIPAAESNPGVLFANNPPSSVTVERFGAGGYSITFAQTAGDAAPLLVLARRTIRPYFDEERGEWTDLNAA